MTFGRVNDTRLLSGGPFKTGFIATLGVLLALLLGSAVISLSTAITLIFLALFICLGLYPVVQRLEGRGFSRTGAVLTVLGAFVLVIGLLAWLIVPILVTQAGQLAAYLPKGLDQVEHQDWFVSVNAAFGGALTPALDWLIAATGDPTVWLFVGGGALRVGAGILNGTAGTIFVVVLTLYFVSSLETIKEGVYSLIPKSKRAGFIELSETIAASVGKYLGGMVILAAMNAVFTFILLTACGVPFAPVLAALAFPITLIPLVGPVINTVIVTAVALFRLPVYGGRRAGRDAGLRADRVLRHDAADRRQGDQHSRVAGVDRRARRWHTARTTRSSHRLPDDRLRPPDHEEGRRAGPEHPLRRPLCRISKPSPSS
ncbi:AI-2E family transporter [Cryobacterium breve]|uniref:AI-2E family transporter n=1 Tax=Cryobacterium breve TaxID=1259258 RepID=UPI003D7C1700